MKTYGKISAALYREIFEDGGSLNTSSLGFTEKAWLCYSLAQAGETEKATPILNQLEQTLNHVFIVDQCVNPDNSCLNSAFWLWACGTCRSAGWSGAIDPALIQLSIESIGQQWKKPQEHWLKTYGGNQEAAVWFSNLSIAYGALLAIQPHAKDEYDRIQQLLKEIREFVFAKFIKEGKIVSRLGSDEIYGDIVLSAVPFGLLGIEDRILIEALYVVERELASNQGVRLYSSDSYYGGCERPDLTALLAWYYSEKGDLARAKSLLTGIEKNSDVYYTVFEHTAREPLYREYWRDTFGDPPVNPLSMMLYSIADQSLSSKLTSGEARGNIQFLHEPIGTNDPYVHYINERLPRHPEGEQLVRIRAVTQPFRAEQKPLVSYRVNGGEWNKTPMKLGISQEGESYWEAVLGRFEFGDEVVYKFETGDEVSQSDIYAFHVRKWIPLGELKGWESLDEGVVLHFGSLPGMKQGASLSFQSAAVNDALHIRMGQRESANMDLASAPGHSANHAFGDWELQITENAITRDFTDVTVIYKGRVLIKSYGRHGQAIAEFLSDGQSVYGIRCNFQLEDADRLYGMGERYSCLEYRGITVDNYVYNEYRSQGMRTYMPVPLVINSSGYGLFANTPMYSNFDFGHSLSDRMQIQSELLATNPSFELILMPGQPLEVVRTYTDITGKPVLPPKWAFGPWMSSNNWDSQDEALKQAELTKRYEIPATVFVLEQWSDEATFYIFNDAKYEVKDGKDALQFEDFEFPEWGRWPNPKEMVGLLHEDGMKVLLWQIPIQKYLYGVAHGQKDADETAMVDAGYHVRDAKGNPYRIPYNWFKDSLVIDFTNQDAKNWWFDKRKYLLTDIGVDGFKTDGGECIFGPDLQFADGRTGAEMRNLYPNLYIGSYYTFIQDHVAGGGITFSRAGYSGAQNYPLHWAGDERSTFDAFRSSLHAGLSSAMSGIPFWGWDLAGFHGDIPTAELFIRSTQMAAFCPVMQYHAETKGEFNQDRTPWNIAERTECPEVIDLYKKYADLRMNLLPYIYAQALISSREGIPMMRPMYAEFPGDPSCHIQYGQYMFGDGLLVAPIIEEGAFTKTVYFPEGSWMSLLGKGEEVAGGQFLTIPADLDHIPVYIRANTLIPLNLNSSLNLPSHVGNRVDGYENLTFCLYTTSDFSEGMFTFEDDLGAPIEIVTRKSEDSMMLQVESSDRSHSLVIWLRGISGVKSISDECGEYQVMATDEELSEGTYRVRNGETWLRIRKSSGTVTLSL